MIRTYLKKKTFAIGVISLFIIIGCGLMTPLISPKGYHEIATNTSLVFYYPFNSLGNLYEAGERAETRNRYWWLDSGAALVIKNGVGGTIKGPLELSDPWRILYFYTNTLDTERGLYPQNIFRLLTMRQWGNYTEEAYFKITAVNPSASPNRNMSNGLLLFNRYKDANNLYYAGIRVDGNAVIKKKIDGEYYTMALNPIFAGTYNARTKPNLIPINTWIGIRNTVRTLEDGSVHIILYLDIGRTGHWIVATQAIDDGSVAFGGAPFRRPGFVGIRTDFMDVEFDDFKVIAQP